MESRFGRDFSRVRLHTDAAAAESAAAVGALAYTVGQDVVFGDGRYAPATAGGRRLLAHELAHTVQQGEGSRSAGPLAIGAPDSPAERDAEQAADGVMAGDPNVSPRMASRPGQLLRRVPASTTAGASQTRIVEETIRFLEDSAEFWRQATLDQGRFDRVIDSWYRMIVEQERIIDRSLNGDPALRQRLRAAYTLAIRVLMPAAARALRTSESELYQRNSGRIPMWAWPTPHHMEPGITTPIAEGRAADPATGRVTFGSGGFEIIVSPDRPDPSLTSAAETKINVNFHWTSLNPRCLTTGGVGFDAPPPPTARIHTAYHPGISASNQSGYGRGTTREDIAGGAVDPRSTRLGFHEGSHGLFYIEYMRSHGPPAFAGTVGMTEEAFATAEADWHAACRKYVVDMDKENMARTDCVGKTLDTFDRELAAPGVMVVSRCP
jgi:hypothetical protein